MKTITVSRNSFLDILDPITRKYLFKVAIDNGWNIRMEGEKWQ